MQSTSGIILRQQLRKFIAIFLCALLLLLCVSSAMPLNISAESYCVKKGCPKKSGKNDSNTSIPATDEEKCPDNNQPNEEFLHDESYMLEVNLMPGTQKHLFFSTPHSGLSYAQLHAQPPDPTHY